MEPPDNGNELLAVSSERQPNPRSEHVSAPASPAADNRTVNLALPSTSATKRSLSQADAMSSARNSSVIDRTFGALADSPPDGLETHEEAALHGEQRGVHDTVDEPTYSSRSEVLYDPQERIEGFDWDEVSLRYHDRVRELNAAERAIMQEYTELSTSFAAWAQSGPKQEVNRGFKRLKTQMKYVQIEEHQLEQRRLHYVKVIDAFQNALQLLAS